MINKYQKTLVLLFLLLVGTLANLHAQYMIRTIAGVGPGLPAGDGGQASNAYIGVPSGIALDLNGNIYVSDQAHNIVRKIAPNGIISTVVGTGYPSGTGDGGPATAATISFPLGLTVDAAGNLYIADAGTDVVRKVTMSTGIISTVAGNRTAPGYSGDGIPATAAKLNGMSGVAFDAAGNLYIADNNTRVRQVTTDGIIHTIVGTGNVGFSGNGSNATAVGVAFDVVAGVCVDLAGNIYVADNINHAVRKVNGASHILNGFAGIATSSASCSGNGGPAANARMSAPIDVKVDAAGNVYIVDQGNSNIRKVDTSGVITAFAGTCSAGFAGDGGPATAAKLNYPYGMWIDAQGNIFIADGNNHRVREIYRTVPMHISASPDTNSICAGTPVTFFANTTILGYGAIYKWQVNGINVTGDTSSFTPAVINDGDHITCILTDTSAGLNLQLAVSDTFIMHVTQVSYPTLSVTSTGDTVCYGLPVTLTAAATNAGTPVFQWQKFGINVDTGISYTQIPHSGDLITCIMTSGLPCAIPQTLDTSLVMVATPSYAPAMTLHADPNDTITYWGEVVSLFSDVTYGGTAPTFQWYENGHLIPGATSASYSAHFYANDTFYCVLTSNAPCAVPLVDTSNIIYVSTGTLGVADVMSSGSGISLSPNPNTGSFILFVSPDAVAGTQLSTEVRNVLGQVVYSQEINTGGQKTEVNYMLPPQLADGMYFLEARDSRQVRTISFLIRH